MKFEFNPRTGRMEPKKDEQIYFAGSMGGGLRIDDHKHNIKYVIERDGRITNIFGVRGASSLNIYDLRDARIIADRVVRMFGKEHKYSNYEYFLKGHVMNDSVVKTCTEYINEGLWMDSIKRSSTGDIKKEDGKLICILEDGTKMILSTGEDVGELIKFGDKPYFYIDIMDLYLIGFTDGKNDTFYKLDKSIKGKPNMVKCMTASKYLRDNDFDELIAVLKSDDCGWYSDDFIDIECEKHPDYIDIEGDCEYYVFKDHDVARNKAIEYVKETIYDPDGKTIKGWLDKLGDDWINEDEIKDEIESSIKNYYDDIDIEEIAEYLLDNNLIELDEDNFDIDDEGDVDSSKPIFNKDSYKDDYVSSRMDSIDDYIQEYIDNFGVSNLDSFINYDRLAEILVDEDGVGYHLSSYDGKEVIEYIGKMPYYIYRMN